MKIVNKILKLFLHLQYICAIILTSAITLFMCVCPIYPAIIFSAWFLLMYLILLIFIGYFFTATLEIIKEYDDFITRNKSKK